MIRPLEWPFQRQSEKSRPGKAESSILALGERPRIQSKGANKNGGEKTSSCVSSLGDLNEVASGLRTKGRIDQTRALHSSFLKPIKPKPSPTTKGRFTSLPLDESSSKLDLRQCWQFSLDRALCKRGRTVLKRQR